MEHLVSILVVMGVRKVVNRVLTLVLLVALVAAGIFAFTQRQEIADYFRANNFTPTSEIESLVDQLALTDSGERVFFASHPTLDASQRFNDHCAGVDHSEQGHVLGCYAGENIHLFAVTDERLGGVVEATAAHELLHATYSRLNVREKETLAKQLNDAYEELIIDDSSLEERMAVYDHLSPSAFANELHSVLGTEVRELPEALERHFGQWFSDRDMIVDNFEAYHTVFTELQDQAKQLQDEMTALRDDVETRRDAYDAAVEQFNLDVADFQRRNANFEYSDKPAEFQYNFDTLEERRNQLESTLAGLQHDIDYYEELRAELQKLSQTSDELDQLLNSELAPPATRPDQ